MSPEDWDVVIRDHHVGYIDWEEYERNQAQLAKNAFGRAGGVKSGRGGGALLAGLLCCARCGRRLHVVYTGRTPRPVYRCENPNLLLGQKRCITFGGFRPDKLIAGAVLEAVAPFAIDAAIEARSMLNQAAEGSCNKASVLSKPFACGISGIAHPSIAPTLSTCLADWSLSLTVGTMRSPRWAFRQ